MSIDLGQLLDVAGPLAVSAIETSGTSVTFTRPDPDADVTVNPTTLEVTDDESTVESGIPAIIIGGSAQAQPFGPEQTLAAGQYRILLLPDVDTIREGDLCHVDETRDPLLANRTLKITAVTADGAGVVRALTAEDLP